MTVTLYSVSDDNNVVSKSLGSGTNKQCKLKDDCNIINPVIMLSNVTAAELKDKNYCYIEEFGRYYFIEDITVETGFIWRLHCHVDVLQTYGDQIKKLSALLATQETEANLYLQSNQVPTLAKRKLNEYTFDEVTLGDSWTTVLVTIGLMR